jgi:quercetin dioxygenase-like cupin family protein
MLGPDGDEARVPAGAVARVPPLVVHGFRNGSDADVRYLNFHAPGVAFADYLRAMRDGRAFSYDQEDPPADGGRPISEAVIGAPANGDDAVVHADVDAIRITERTGDVAPACADGVVSLYVLDGEVVLTVEGAEHRARAGTWAQVPPGTAHAVSALGAARMLLVQTPPP